MRLAKATALAGAIGLLLAGAAGLSSPRASSAWAERPAQPKPETVSVRRLTESQYRHAIADTFGADIQLNARFEPEKREDGLLALGGAQLSLTSSGFEQYYALASSIADQTLNDDHRTTTLGCAPKDEKKADDTCARKFIAKVGAQLFRRPLTKAEIDGRVKTAATGAASAKNFNTGAKLALVSLLMAPDFLFRIEQAEPDPGKPGALRLNGYGKAQRISFLLWDAAPDAALLEAAKSGAIHTEAGLSAQLKRMTASPRFRDGARAFFVDMLQLDGFDNLIKDSAAYPKFNQAVADSAREQTLRTVIDLVVDKKRDYRDIFSSNETFINRSLAAVYRVPFVSAAEWAPYTFDASSERSGVLTQVSFLSLFAHPAGSSPTRRGLKVHEIFMCEPTPDPPADVDFTKVRDSKSGTVRGRLLDHMSNPGCTACHRRSDPPGLMLEHFDGLGQLRQTENGAMIDVSAEIDGKQLSGAQGLSGYLRENPKIPACLVRNVYAYGTGRKPGIRDEDYLFAQTKGFAANNYRFADLMMQIAASPEFLNPAPVSGARPASSAAKPH